MTVDLRALLAQHHYAVIDLTIIGAEDWHRELPLQDIVHPEMRGDIGRTPKLLPLKADAPYMGWLVENIEAARAGKEEYLFSCLLVAPETPPDAMMGHLKKHVVFDSPQGLAILRYYDGRVFPHLLRMLDIYSLGGLFGPIKTWTFRLLDEWISVQPPETQTVRTYWKLPRDVRERLDRILQINQTLHAWQRRYKRPWKNLDEFQAISDFAEETLREIQHNAQLQDEDAQNAFVLNAIATYYNPRLGIRS
jgi:hypothetical protein